MILADYRCGCTWVGERGQCLEYCGKHGENRRRVHDIGSKKALERFGVALGWCWQKNEEKADGKTMA